MLKLALFVAVVVAGPVAAQTAAPEAPPPSPAPMSAEAIASDPRMIAAIRHANAVADRKCGEGIGGVVDLATKAEAARCRRRMIATAKLDAEGEITGH